MGRTPFPLRLFNDIYELVKDEARNQRRSMNQLIGEIIADYFKRNKEA